MLNMKETALLGLIISFAVALTASLILGAWTHEVQLVTTPDLRNIYVPADEPFNISCEGLGGDENKFSEMKWLNPTGNVVADGIPGVVKSGKNILHLLFTKPKMEDSGTYTCTAVYDRDYNLKYLANIKFYGPAPEFESTFENLTVNEDSNVNMYCSALGQKPMTYKWYDKNDVIIPEQGEEISVSSSENFSSLIIREVKKHHEGMYTCSAENEHGLMSKLYNLKVIPKTGNDGDFPDITVVNVSASGVEFRIDVDESVKYIEVKYRESRDDTEYRTRFTKVSGNLYRIEHLIPSGFYTFQFKKPDKDLWSNVYNVTLLPAVPELIFQKLSDNTVKFEWLRGVDDTMRGTIDKYLIKYYTLSWESGRRLVPNSCAVTIEVPSCSGSRYTITDLSYNIYYQLEVRAHTQSGYGEPVFQKIFMPR